MQSVSQWRCLIFFFSLEAFKSLSSFYSLQFLGNFQVLISSPGCTFDNYFVINKEIGEMGATDGLQFPNSI